MSSFEFRAWARLAPTLWGNLTGLAQVTRPQERIGAFTPVNQCGPYLGSLSLCAP